MRISFDLDSEVTEILKLRCVYWYVGELLRLLLSRLSCVISPSSLACLSACLPDLVTVCLVSVMSDSGCCPCVSRVNPSQSRFPLSIPCAPFHFRSPFPRNSYSSYRLLSLSPLLERVREHPMVCVFARIHELLHTSYSHCEAGHENFTHFEL